MNGRLLASAAALGLGAAWGGSAAAAEDCAALADLRLDNVNMLSAVMVDDDALGAYCSVRGYVRPAVNFEIRLPEEWNGGFYMAGCGGLCGQLNADAPGFVNAMNHGLARGYAAATMDGGHWGASSADARWAQHDRKAEVDWAERAVRETAIVGQQLTDVFYGADPEPSIFAGCSTGGRQANMLALNDPELFDGILNGAPALDYTGLVGSFMAAIVQANTDAHGNQIIGPDDVALIEETVADQCAGADGLIDDPDGCEVDFSEVACDGDGEDCLTEAQIATLDVWYETGAVTSEGESLYPATIPPGSEPFWPLWLTGAEPGGGFVPAISEGFLQFMAFREDRGEGFSIQDFDFESDPEAMDFMAAIYNADTPDLSAFAEAGGRMITWHGLADAIVPHGKTVDYFEALRETHGDELDAVNRLFLIPGMDHCGIQPGPGITSDGFDPLSALEDWLAEDEAPAQLMTTRFDAEGEADWSRPVCAWPARAMHDGEGDWRDPEAYSCETP